MFVMCVYIMRMYVCMYVMCMCMFCEWVSVYVMCVCTCMCSLCVCVFVCMYVMCVYVVYHCTNLLTHSGFWFLTLTGAILSVSWNSLLTKSLSQAKSPCEKKEQLKLLPGMMMT